MPTPPAMNMTRLILFTSMPGGGHTKLPPTRTLISFPWMFSNGCHNHAAGGLSGLFCIASSKYGLCSGSDCGNASRGDEVMVKPPAFSTSGTKTSSHWPGWNLPQPSAYVGSEEGTASTFKPFVSLRWNRNSLILSFTGVTFETVAACMSFCRGSVAVRSWWLNRAFAALADLG